MHQNIVIISIDSLRADGTNYNRELIYGKGKHNYIKTPNLDKFSKSGTSFIKAYSTNTYTTSAHASLFTGTYPPEHGIRTFFDFNQRLNPKTTTLAEELLAKGYQTFFYSDVKELFSEMNIWKGFRVKTYGKSDWLWNSIEELRKDKNFIFLHLFDVHEPYLYIEDESVDEKINEDYFQAVDDLRKELKIKSKINQIEKPHGAWEEIRKFLIENNLDHQYYLKKYYDLGVEKFDQRIKKIFNKFLKLGFDLDKDLFILLSDHGEGRDFFSSKTSFAHAGELTEETLRVFLATNFKYSNEEESSESKKLVSLADIKYFVLKKKLSHNEKIYGESFTTVFENFSPGMTDGESKIGRINKKGEHFLLNRAFIFNDKKILLRNQPESLIKLDQTSNLEKVIKIGFTSILGRLPGKNSVDHHIELFNSGKINKKYFVQALIDSEENKKNRFVLVFDTSNLLIKNEEIAINKAGKLFDIVVDIINFSGVKLDRKLKKVDFQKFLYKK